MIWLACVAAFAAGCVVTAVVLAVMVASQDIDAHETAYWRGFADGEINGQLTERIPSNN